jgi:hypothetical protein
LSPFPYVALQQGVYCPRFYALILPVAFFHEQISARKNGHGSDAYALELTCMMSASPPL